MITSNQSDASCKLFRPSLANQMNGLTIRRKLQKRSYFQRHFGTEMIATETVQIKVENANANINYNNDYYNNNNSTRFTNACDDNEAVININKNVENSFNVGEEKNN